MSLPHPHPTRTPQSFGPHSIPDNPRQNPSPQPQGREHRGFHRGNNRGYTLVEMLTTIAILVIVMGLMVSLARRVRAQSAESQTKNLLRGLDLVMGQYLDRFHQLPVIYPFVPPGLKEGQPLDESQLQTNAFRNNRELRLVLLRQLNNSNRAMVADQLLSRNDDIVRDAWGMPIVFMPTFHPAVGMAPNNRFFFLSAGPDGHFLTRDDNLYSYESAGGKGFDAEK